MFADCSYVNQSIRPPSWSPDQKIVWKFDQLRADTTPRAIALRAVERGLIQGGLRDDGVRP